VEGAVVVVAVVQLVEVVEVVVGGGVEDFGMSSLMKLQNVAR